MATVTVDPFRCRVWALHDRLEEHLTEETCKEEIESFRAHGQLVPVLGRPLSGDRDYDVEIIYGARRLFIARHLNKLLLVELREMTDREAFVAMDIENRHRVDISPYERGLSYRRLLLSGCFGSQGEIARELNVSASRISRLLKLAQLPAVIVNAFGTAANIREEWGLELAKALDDPGRRLLTIRTARALTTRSGLPPQEVFRQLLAASARDRRKLKARSHDEVVSGDKGLVLFRIRQQRKSLAVLLPIQNLSEDSIREIRHLLVNVLQKQRGGAARAVQQSALNRRIQSALTPSD